MLEPFLLGVFYFIVQNRSGKNSLGKKTLDRIGTKVPDKERKLMPDVGATITRSINVDRCNPPDDVIAEGSGSRTGFEGSTCNDAGNDRTAEEPRIADSVPVADGKNVVIQHQTNIIQNGPNNSSLTNYGPVTFYWGGGKK